MKYSLDKYIVSFQSNDSTISRVIGAVSIGGEGSYLGNINISYNSSLWSTNGYATGGWTHNKNLDRTGSVTLSLNQLCSASSKIRQLCNIYYGGDYDGLTVTVTSTEGQLIATCVDCYPQGIPSTNFGESAQDQSWTFTCGKIVFAD